MKHYAVMQNNLVHKAGLSKKEAEKLAARLRKEAGRLCVTYWVTKTG